MSGYAPCTRTLCAKAGDRQGITIITKKLGKRRLWLNHERDRMKHRASVAASSRPAAYPRAIRLSRLLGSAIVWNLL